MAGVVYIDAALLCLWSLTDKNWENMSPVAPSRVARVFASLYTQEWVLKSRLPIWEVGWTA